MALMISHGIALTLKMVGVAPFANRHRGSVRAPFHAPAAWWAKIDSTSMMRKRAIPSTEDRKTLRCEPVRGALGLNVRRLRSAEVIEATHGRLQTAQQRGRLAPDADEQARRQRG